MVQLSSQIVSAITANWFNSHRKLCGYHRNLVKLSPQNGSTLTANCSGYHRNMVHLSPKIASTITANWFGYHRKMVQLLPHNGSTRTTNCFGYHRKKKTIIIRVCTHEYTNTHTQTHIHMHSHMHAHKKDLYMGTTYRFNGKTNYY